MKIDLLKPLLYGLIRGEKEEVHQAFASCISNEKEGSSVRVALQRMYDEYRQREGMAVIAQLDYRIKTLISAPYRNCTFDDIFLSDTIKIYTERILREWEHKDVLIANGLSPINKLLLEGPPGNGKTSYAIALAEKMGIPLLNTNSSVILDSYLGQSEKNVSLLFQYLPEECVLFFDEFEAVATGRGNPGKDAGGSGRAWNSIVTSLLLNIERIRPTVFFIAATNRSDMLDNAVLRRFDITMQFNNPTVEEKNRYIAQYVNQYNLSKDDFQWEKDKFDSTVSYADVERVLKLRHKQIVLERVIGGL